jgi:glycosyltransferase involved in cell wall biosynthesis
MVSTFDREGGAARAAYRLHQGLKELGEDSRMLVQFKTSDDVTVMGSDTKIAKGVALLRPDLDSLPARFYSIQPGNLFSSQWLPDFLPKSINSIQPDILHLHWICRGFMRIETLSKLKSPLVWTLHDSWAFTGGCHYPFECTRYTERCGVCPQLLSRKESDLSRRVWDRKQSGWRNVRIHIVTPSRWLAGCARSSSLFRNSRIDVIPNGIDTEIYKPVDKAFARKVLGLPDNRRLLLFGSANAAKDPRKGFQFLLPALERLRESRWHEKTELMVFGSSAIDGANQTGYKTRFFGPLHDDISLSLVYAAADAFIAPSVQDNLPNTVMEAMACGTPCIAFDIGGMPDMIDHRTNGYLAKPFDVENLAGGIAWLLEDANRLGDLSRAARDKVAREYSLRFIAARYLDIYREAIEQSRGRS